MGGLIHVFFLVFLRGCVRVDDCIQLEAKEQKKQQRKAQIKQLKGGK